MCANHLNKEDAMDYRKHFFLTIQHKFVQCILTTSQGSGSLNYIFHAISEYKNGFAVGISFDLWMRCKL